MDLGTSYWNSLDHVAKRLNISGKDIGISHGIGDVSQGLKANIFAGASQIELGFMGMKKGSRSQPTGVTPETFGKDEREAMRQMAKVNEVELSTHASANVIGLAGYGEGGFRDELKEGALHEIKRAIDFAADVAEGGPVVVHTGEFPRDVASKYYDEEKKIGLRLYPEEKEKGIVQFVDKETGKIIALKRDTKVWAPKVDKYGEPIEKLEKGKPTGRYEYEPRKFDYYEEQAKKEDKDPAELFYKDYVNREIEQYRGEEKRWFDYAEDAKRKIQSFENFKKEIIERAGNKEYAAELVGNFLTRTQREAPSVEIIQEIKKDPIGFLDKQKEEINRSYDYAKDITLNYGKRREEIEESLKNIQPIEEYALDKTADTISNAAMHAYEIEKKKKLKKPLFVAPENIFQEQYGSHPEELKKIIVESREAMTKKLIEQKNMSERDAKREAEDHIKATFDIGHAHNWRKYFKGSDKQYNEWLQNQVKKLAEDGIIGHVHISDNFGYYDEHITPGEGTAPIKEFIAELNRKGKFKGQMVVEPGGQPEGKSFEALKGAWRTLKSPMYRIDSTGTAWTDIENSYFGRTTSPNYLVGDVAPSKDWSLWSETQLE